MFTALVKIGEKKTLIKVIYLIHEQYTKVVLKNKGYVIYV